MIRLHTRGNSQLSIDEKREKKLRVIVVTVVCTRGMPPLFVTLRWKYRVADENLHS